MSQEAKLYPLESSKQMQVLLADHYRNLREAKAAGKKICWATGQAPTDLVSAMGVIPAYPENHCAQCGVAKVGTQLCQVAEQHGYSPDLCSYARNCLGSAFQNDPNFKVPPIPEPDILIAVTMCNSHIKWWEAMSRYYKVPLLLLDTPFIHDRLSRNEIDSGIKYAENQIKDMTKFLSEWAGRPYDWDRLQECVDNSAEAGKRYAEFVKSGQNRPSPISAFDTFLHLAPLMIWRGFKEPISYYDTLLAEVRERVKNKVSAVGQEKYRLYWDNIPVWYRVGWMGRKLSTYGACTVVACYPWAWIDNFASLDSEHPVESIARSQGYFYQNTGTGRRVEFLNNLIRDFSVDGLLAQVSMSCKAFAADQAVIIKESQKQMGVPAVMIEGDMVDERFFSEDQVTRQIEDFMEVLTASGN